MLFRLLCGFVGDSCVFAVVTEKPRRSFAKAQKRKAKRGLKAAACSILLLRLTKDLVEFPQSFVPDAYDQTVEGDYQTASRECVRRAETM